MRTLIFDISITGHHSEYIGHIVDYLVDNKPNDICIFVVHYDFLGKFPEIVSKTRQVENVIWETIPIKEYEKCFRGGLIRKSFNYYQLMHLYAKRFDVDHVLLLYFNIVQFATIFFRPKYTISGILFLQFYRMSAKTWNEKLKYYRKFITTKLYCLNPKINRIFVLNDSKTVDFLNRVMDTDIFKMLPDPIPNLKALEGFDIYKHYCIENNRKIFLHIGSLGERKGTFEIIDAALKIPFQNQKEVAILLVGKVNSIKVEEFINTKINEIKSNCNVTLIWDNQFVSNHLMKSLFDQCFAVLMPYKNTEASSGILGHAAAANKIVISTGKGLLKELIENYKLGLLVNEVTSDEISEKILESFNYKPKEDLLLQFVALHTTSFFVKELLENE
jgi:glycosyltransferase involved in cell wall biosynthesis